MGDKKEEILVFCFFVSDMTRTRQIKNKVLKIWNFGLFLPRMPFLFFIKIYQKTLSPDHGLFKFLFPRGCCRYYPTCSCYGYEIIKKKGLVKGIPKILWRILRCNPLSRGGVDLPE